MIVQLRMRKHDRGYKAMALDTLDRGGFFSGEVIQNRNFKPYSRGTLLVVTFNITYKGRRVVKHIRALEDGESMGVSTEPKRFEKVIVRGDDGVVDTWSKEIHEKETVEARWGKAEEEEVHTFEVKEMKLTLLGEEKEEVDTDASEALERVIAKREKRMATPKDRPELNGYYISDESRLVFTTAHGMSNARPERAVKIMMVGASGYGKTTLPKVFAEVTGKRFLRMNCATIRDPEEWFGYREAKDGSTVFVRSQFGREIEEGNLVVVLDEFNRLEPWLHNTLFPLLDDDGCTVVHDEQFRIGPNVIVVGTINTGYKYTGTFELDEALLNRFDFIVEVGPMPHAQEVKVLSKRTGIENKAASSIVKVANILRQSEVVCSTRTSLLIANMVQSGMNVREAYETAVVRRTPADSGNNGLRKQVIDLINVQLGVYEPRNVEGDVFRVKGSMQEVEEDGGEEEYTEHKSYELTLKINPRADFLLVTAIQQLRRLPLLMAKDDPHFLGLSEAKNLADKIKEGEEVHLYLTHKPEDFDDIIVSMKNAGFTGNFSVKNV